MKRAYGSGLEEDGDSTTDTSGVGMGQRERRSSLGRFVNGLMRVRVAGEMVKEGKVRGDEIALGREVATAQVFVEGLCGFVELQGENEGMKHGSVITFGQPRLVFETMKS